MKRVKSRVQAGFYFVVVTGVIVFSRITTAVTNKPFPPHK